MPTRPPIHHPYAAKPPARPSARARGYGSAWEALRLAVLKRDCYLCQECKRANVLYDVSRRKHDAHVDHIVPKPCGDDSLGNLETLCRRHHSIKTAREDGGFGNAGRRSQTNASTDAQRGAVRVQTALVGPEAHVSDNVVRGGL